MGRVGIWRLWIDGFGWLLFGWGLEVGNGGWKWIIVLQTNLDRSPRSEVDITWIDLIPDRDGRGRCTRSFLLHINCNLATARVAVESKLNNLGDLSCLRTTSASQTET